MGRRTRKRSAPPPEHRRSAPAAPEAPLAPVVPQPLPRRRARLDEAPRAPWAPFPLVELCILVGIVLIVVGVVAAGQRRGALLGAGFGLVSLSALELSIREHFAGYRSHTFLLAACAAIVADVPLFFLTRLPQEILLGVGLAVFGLVAWALRGVFRRRTGGMAFRA